jgi:hypothetical protein
MPVAGSHTTRSPIAKKSTIRVTRCVCEKTPKMCIAQSIFCRIKKKSVSVETSGPKIEVLGSFRCENSPNLVTLSVIRVARFFFVQHTKTGENIPINH